MDEWGEYSVESSCHTSVMLWRTLPNTPTITTALFLSLSLSLSHSVCVCVCVCVCQEAAGCGFTQQRQLRRSYTQTFKRTLFHAHSNLRKTCIAAETKNNTFKSNTIKTSEKIFVFICIIQWACLCDYMSIAAISALVIRAYGAKPVLWAATDDAHHWFKLKGYCFVSTWLRRTRRWCAVMDVRPGCYA